MELIDEAYSNGARIKKACVELEISERTYFRWKKSLIDRRPEANRPEPKNKISESEKKDLLDIINTPKYRDLPASQIVPLLADEGKYIASERTLYRFMKELKLNTKRISTKKHNKRTITTHIAHNSNEVWSWDITWLPGPAKGKYYKLYLILDIFSRMIVGWEVWEEELAEHAQTLIKRTTFKHGVLNKPLVLHSDNGSPMRAKTFQVLLENLGITKSYSRPRVSNDNPFSESLFRTLKYNKNFLKKGFTTLKEARNWVLDFVEYYNKESLHSGISFITPYSRHYGLDVDILENRKKVYKEAKDKNPNRWSKETRNWNRIQSVSLNPTDEMRRSNKQNINVL